MEAAIDATLRRLAHEGFPRAQVDAVVHQIELDEREVSPSPNPTPLTLTVTVTLTLTTHPNPNPGSLPSSTRSIC